MCFSSSLIIKALSKQEYTSANLQLLVSKVALYAEDQHQRRDHFLMIDLCYFSVFAPQKNFSSSDGSLDTPKDLVKLLILNIKVIFFFCNRPFKPSKP